MERAWVAKNRLLELDVPLETALYVLPNAKALRFHESGSLLYLAHKWVMRTCFNAQEEIYRASMDELDQVRALHPRLARHMGPPCVPALLAHHADLHRGRALLRRAGVAVVPERHAAA
jgi:thymidylate synthase ThyX